MELTIIYLLTKINEEISHNISEFFQKKTDFLLLYIYFQIYLSFIEEYKIVYFFLIR